MQSILEQVSSLLSGDLNYDRVAEAKQIIQKELSEEQPILSNEKMAKLLSSSPEKKLTFVYRDDYLNSVNLYGCQNVNGKNQTFSGTRRADGCKIYQTDGKASTIAYPPGHATLDDTATNAFCTLNTAHQNSYVVDLDHLDIVAIVITTDFTAVPQLYVRSKNGWTIIDADNQLFSINSFGINVW